MLLFLFTFSCQKKFEQPDESSQVETHENYQARPVNPNGNNQYIILGREKEIPYSVENMQRAVDYINDSVQNSKYTKKVIRPTHYYVKFIPATEEHLQILDEMDKDTTIVLFNYPLHYEIIQQGRFLQGRTPEEIKYAELYTTVPNYYQFPDVPYEIIEELYEPAEDEGDLEVAALVLTGNEEDLDIIYNGEPLSMTNLSAFLNDPQAQQRLWRRYEPYGYFKVYDTEISGYVGVMNTRLVIGRWFWWQNVYTDRTGKFTAGRRYRGRVTVRAKWRTSIATLRRSFNELIGIGVSDYLMRINRSNNGRWYLTGTSNGHLWPKATVHNALVKYNDYMEPRGVSGVYHANVWVLNGRESQGTALMMKRYTWTTSSGLLLGMLENWLTLYFAIPLASVTHILNALVSHLYPDMILQYDSCDRKDTKQIEQLVFHESGHFSHAVQTGSQYWGEVVYFYTDNIVSLGGDSYGDGDDPDLASGRLIALVEGWATFCEYAVLRGYYTSYTRLDCPNNSYNEIDIIPYMEGFNMYTVPMTANPMYDNESWFLSGLIWDIIDDSPKEPGTKLKNGQTNSDIRNIIDNLSLSRISGTYAPVYDRLNGSVHNGYDLKKALTGVYPHLTYQINELFYSYGY